MGRYRHDRARRDLLARIEAGLRRFSLMPVSPMPLAMRWLLEFLGIVEPEGVRREPVALPAWSRRLLTIVIGGWR